MLHGPRTNPRNMQHHYMGPGYMGAPQMRPHHMHQNPFGHMQMMQHGQFSPAMMGRAPKSRQGGGLLAKLLGKSGRGNNSGIPGFASAAANGPVRAASSGGGFLKTLTDPVALNGFLNNTQQVLKTAQQFGPMIQQYGPLVRNLPSMWKLYKGLKDLPNAEETGEQQTAEEPVQQKKSVKISSQSPDTTDNKIMPKKRERKRNSTPKLFY
jgi:hypothetical protein